jgi:hypothetical protein
VSVDLAARISRRTLLGSAAGGAAAVALGATFLPDLLGDDPAPSRGALPPAGYGPVGPPDANGIRLPEGFSATVVCDFLASGGEGFSGFTRGRERAAAGKDIDALVDYAERLLPPP